MATSITWTWECDFCGAKKTESQAGLEVNSRIAIPCDLPRNWSYISPTEFVGAAPCLVCPKHKVAVDPEDKP